MKTMEADSFLVQALETRELEGDRRVPTGRQVNLGGLWADSSEELVAVVWGVPQLMLLGTLFQLAQETSS